MFICDPDEGMFSRRGYADFSIQQYTNTPESGENKDNKALYRERRVMTNKIQVYGNQ